MALAALIVSRDMTTVQILRQALEQHGVRVEHCDDPQTAVVRLREQHFRLLVLGFEKEAGALPLLEQIQASAKAETGQRTLLIGAILESYDQTDGLFDCGADFILYKPLSAENVVESMQSVWSQIPAERRRQPRISVSSPASIDFGATANAPASILNLNQDGVTIHSSGKMPFPCRVYLQFALPGQTAPVRLSGDVVWQDWKGRVGIRFSHVPQASRRLIEQWMDTATDHNIVGKTPLPLVMERILVRSETEDKLQNVTVSADSDEDERRAQARKICRLGVTVYPPAGDVLQQCTLTDASAGGCYIETTQPLPVGTRLTVEIRTQDTKLRVYGKVRSTHRGYGMGVEFNLVTEEEKLQTRQLMSCLDEQLEIKTGSLLERE